MALLLGLAALAMVLGGILMLLVVAALALPRRARPGRPVEPAWLDVERPGVVRVVLPDEGRRRWVDHPAGPFEVVDRRVNAVEFTPSPALTRIASDDRPLRATLLRMWQRGEGRWFHAPTPRQERALYELLAR